MAGVFGVPKQEGYHEENSGEELGYAFNELFVGDGTVVGGLAGVGSDADELNVVVGSRLEFVVEDHHGAGVEFDPVVDLEVDEGAGESPDAF